MRARALRERYGRERRPMGDFERARDHADAFLRISRKEPLHHAGKEIGVNARRVTEVRCKEIFPTEREVLHVPGESMAQSRFEEKEMTALDADKACIWVLSGASNEEGTITTAEVIHDITDAYFECRYNARVVFPWRWNKRDIHPSRK
jgi:hypothetical protein